MKILVLSMHDDRSLLNQLLRAGAAGYVVKRAVHTELLTAIRAVGRGDMFLDPSLVKEVVPDIVRGSPRADSDGAEGSLTEREQEVLRLVALGYSNREIADKLYLGVRTVETHRARLMEKTGVRDRAGLVRHALKLGLLDDETSA